MSRLFDTAPPPESDSGSTPAPTSSSSPPPPDSSPPPPPNSSAPPPSSDASPPPPTPPPPPPPKSNSSSPSPPPPPPKSNGSSPSPPPPPASGVLSPPNSSGGGHPTAPPPPPAVSSDSDTSGSATNVRQLVVGATVGLGLFLLAMVVVCILCGKRKKRKPDHHDHHLHYYPDPSHHGPKDHGMYYNNNTQQPGNWHVAPPQGPGEGAWGSKPPRPLPPGLMNSGEAGGGFSGGPGLLLPPPSPGLSLGFNKSTFTYDELAGATDGFSEANLLGQGGFGYVHKGVLPNGKEVAVKSLKSGSGQGEREFQAEVEIISRVHHRHLVSLVGYCIAGGQRMLVYQFVPNNTLEYHLYGNGLPAVDWPTRLRIATGSAKGLSYLHEDCHPRIIHRDIKTSNILLDFNFEAKVADFGLAKLSSDNFTHVSTRVMGTFGYLAPEYASSGKLTEKSDVFSFGVMLLELITGRRPVDTTSAYMEDSLVDWAKPLLQRALEEGVYDELVDPRLENNYNPNEMARMVACAAASIRHSARKRPKMSQIVRALEGDVSLDDLNEGVKPGQSSIYASSGSSDYDMNAYNADMKKFRQAAMPSQEFAGSDLGTSSSDSREIASHGNQKQQL